MKHKLSGFTAQRPAPVRSPEQRAAFCARCGQKRTKVVFKRRNLNAASVELEEVVLGEEPLR